MRRNRDEPPRESTPLRRWVRRAGLTSFIVLLVIALAGYPVYVRPQIDPVRKADALLILGGPTYDRYVTGLELGAQGWAPTVVLSNPYEADHPWLSEQCATPRSYELLCFGPEPSTTKGEGRELRRLAAERGWRTVIVVTFKPHVSRARYILEQCFDGELVMVEPPGPLSARRWISEFPYQTVGYVRAVLQPGC